MAEKNQAEWIYEVLGKKKGILGASIRELTDAEEKKIKDKMLQYWKEHNDESTEFLVNGAILCCSRGSDYSTLNSADHGVYTDSSETGALANTDDKKFDGFVACSKWNDEPLVSKHICRFKLGEWRNVRKNVSINGKYALDTNSYLPCKHGGIISPVTSGQEYTLSKSYNKYPKFLNDDGTVDELIVKKLLLRNVSVMKENEKDALIKLGMYLCVCKDVEILKKIINCGYIASQYNRNIAESGIQLTILDNFIYVASCAEAYCRFCASAGKVPLVQNSNWDKYGEVCKYLKENNKSIVGLNMRGAHVYESIENMFLNVKLLETMVTAGNLYGKKGENAIVDLTTKIATIGEKKENGKEKEEVAEGISKNIKTYTLQYIDGRMENKAVRDKGLGYTTGILPGFATYIHKVHLFSFSDDNFMSGMSKFIDDIEKSIGANISGVATTINYGTAAVSIAMANPIFAPISAPIGVICTLLSTSSGFVDAMRSDGETEYSKVLAIKEINKCINMSYLGGCVGLYTAYACHEIYQPEDKMDVWDTYKNNYKGKTDVKARKEGYATQDTTLKDRNVVKQKLGQGYSYSISVIDSTDTIKRLKNFNDNMMNIRISGEEGTGISTLPKTISEEEGMEEFKEIKNLEELIAYMNRVDEDNEYYLYTLSVMGADGSGLNARITFDMGDGTENVIHEHGTIGIRELFTMPYRTYEYQRGIKVDIE